MEMWCIHFCMVNMCRSFGIKIKFNEKSKFYIFSNDNCTVLGMVHMVSNSDRDHYVHVNETSVLNAHGSLMWTFPKYYTTHTYSTCWTMGMLKYIFTWLYFSKLKCIL